MCRYAQKEFEYQQDHTQVISGKTKVIFLQNLNRNGGFEVQRVLLGQLIPFFSENRQNFVLFSKFLANWVPVSTKIIH